VKSSLGNIPDSIAARVLELSGQPSVRAADTISEKAFMAAVIAEAKRNGWRVYHTHDSRKSEAGFPDLLLLRHTRIMVAELKVGDNKPTAAQLNWLEAFGDATVEWHVWRPDQWAEIVERLATK